MKVLIIAICFPFCTCAQLTASQEQQLHDLLIGFGGRNPGIAVSIVSDTGLVYDFYAGYENIGKNRLVTIDSEFNLASITKQTVALSYLDLFGMEALDTMRLKDITNRFSHFSSIRIMDLINHCSGIREFHTIRQLKGIKNSKRLKPEEVEAYLKEWKSLSYQPGTQHSYSNSNYYILSEALSDYQSKRSFTDHMMYRSASSLDQMHYNQKDCANPAFGHSGFSKFEMIRSKEEVPGYSNLYASSHNFQTWMKYLLSAEDKIDAIRRSYFLSDERNTKVPYNLGFVLSIYDQDSIFEHGGNSKGFQTFMRLIPNKKLGISVFINNDAFGAEYYVDKIHEILNGLRPNLPTDIIGKVVNSKDEPIPSAEVYLNNNTGPGLANDTGFFFYRTLETVEQLIFNSYPYNPISLNIDVFEKPKIVTLKANNHTRDGLINAQKLNFELEEPKRIYSMAPWVNTPGGVIVNSFGSKESQTSLDTISVYITDEALESTPFRFVVYSEDLQTGWPSQLPAYQSEPVHCEKGNSWLSMDISEAKVRMTGKYYVGIQWLTANGSNGSKAQYIGFDAEKNSNISYYRSPFDKWRRVGELMFRGNRDILINTGSKQRNLNDKLKTEIKTFYLHDDKYETYYPATLENGHLFLELYPHSREVRFEQSGVNTWRNESGNWTFRADFNEDGEYEFKDEMLGRIGQEHAVVNYGFESENQAWQPKVYSNQKVKLVSEEGDIKWKIKIQEGDLKIRLKRGRYMILKHFHNDTYFLDGDVSFGRCVKVITNEAKKITAIQYSDSRNFKIQLKAF